MNAPGRGDGWRQPSGTQVACPQAHPAHRSALSPGSGPWDLPSFELPLLPQFLGVGGYPRAEHGPRSSPVTLKVGAQVPFLDLFG